MKKKYIKPISRSYRVAFNQILAQSGDGEENYDVTNTPEGKADIWYESKRASLSSDIWNNMQ